MKNKSKIQNENSTDKQSAEYFILEGGLSKSEAVYWIGRNYYLNNRVE